jgi:hypothetical protein
MPPRLNKRQQRAQDELEALAGAGAGAAPVLADVPADDASADEDAPRATGFAAVRDLGASAHSGCLCSAILQLIGQEGPDESEDDDDGAATPARSSKSKKVRPLARSGSVCALADL